MTQPAPGYYWTTYYDEHLDIRHFIEGVWLECGKEAALNAEHVRIKSKRIPPPKLKN